MAVGHVAFDAWPVVKFDRLRLWHITHIMEEGGNQIAIVSDANFSTIANSKEISLNQASLETLRKFTELLEVSIYGIPSAPRPFTLFYALVDSSLTICWSLITEIVTPSLHRSLGSGDIPNPPFIVTHTPSGATYLVNSVINESPDEFIIPLNLFGAQKHAPSQIVMSGFYKDRYGVTLSPSQPVLMGILGAPIRPDPPADTPSLAVSKTKKPNVRSQVYLAPELVKIHPLTKIIGCVNRIPRMLFQLEAGLIAARVASDLFIPKDNEFRCYFKFFIPSRPSYFFRAIPDILTATALTRPSANMTVDYEYLEWLGDAVYRFVLALLGIRNQKNRAVYFKLMSNNNIGKMAQEAYPDLSRSYILSQPPSLKTPEICRERLTNLNILADVVEALMAVSFMVGGVDSVSHTIERLGLSTVHESSEFLVPPSANDLASFLKSAVRPSVVRLEASLQLIRRGDPQSLDVGQLDDARQLLIATLSKKDLSSFELYTKFCAPLLV